jgi:hypothetical protein
MVELQRNFLLGVMNKDLDPHFLPDGAYRDALNIIVGDSDGAFVEEDGSRNGVAQNYLGNILKGTDYELTNAMCIGSLAYETNNSIYWLVASDTLDAIYEYNETLDITTPVIQATKLTSTTPSLLGFNKEYFVTGINYINGLLFWTDNLNPPRRINIDRAKNYAVDGFTEADINVILAPPLSAPTINLYSEGEANNLENKFLYFSYRYKYLDNEYSALSPFSPVAFFPKEYAYDYGVSENISMVNSFNTADITFNSGSNNVKEIQLIFRDTLSTNTYVIDNLVKLLNEYDDNTEYSFQFKNNKVFTVLPIEQVNRLFDNVPIRAKSQELIGSRLVYGNYTQFFDLLKENKEPINPAFTLSLLSNSVLSGTPTPTFKSNRDYEIGITYLDDYGRTTTVITPTENTNTIYIPPVNAVDANNIRVTINGTYQPPAFATHYRFMIKQDKQDYYNVFPLTYFEDGQFKWFLINQAEQDKISVGSYVYIKSETSNTNTEYKILDIQSKSANFLNSASVNQPAGVYFKVKIDSTSLPPVTYYNDNNVGGFPSTATTLVENRFNVAEDSIFYGVGIDDMITGASNAYTGTNDARFYVEIDSTSGVADTFKYYVSYNGNYKTLVASGITVNSSADQTLTYSGSTCSIRFLSNTGHTTKDYWVVNCRGNLQDVCLNIFGGVIDYGDDFPPGVFFTLNGWSESLAYNTDRPIKAGAVLTFKYKETNGTDQFITQTFISTKDYVNIEEWFIEDLAYQKWIAFNEADESIGPKNVCFRRGELLTTGRPGSIDQGSVIAPSTLSYPVYMYFYSEQGGTNPAIDTKFSLQQSEFSIVFETVPVDTNQDIYYELSKTYPIIDGNHYGNVDNQDIALGAPAIIDLNTLDFNSDFNAFTFGNGVESFRIRDAFNSATMQFSPRANSTIEGYEEQTLVQALTYSGIYTQTSAINRLNEFNLSLGNFKYLDRFFGSIQKLYSRDTDLVVLQENKISKVLYGKNLLSDSTGGGVVASIPEVLGTQIAYTGEYGISLNPESFTIWGNDLFFTDARRGAVVSLQPNGLFEISSQGMKNWFKANLDTNTVKLGMFDPYFEHYVLALDNDRKLRTCAISVTPTTLSFNGSVEKKSFYIESNTDWIITVPVNDWLTVSDKFGSDNQLIYVEVLENTGSSRNLNITVSGCTEDIIISVTQATMPVVYDWYELLDCDTSTTSYSEQYAENTFFINDRVTSGESVLTITDVVNSEPVGTLIPITSTGLFGCPSGPVFEWYILYKCSDGSSANSEVYAENTFELNDRVTSGGNTYIVDGIINYNPGGTLLAITATGLTGCPSPTTYYELAECSPGTGYAFTTIVPDSVGRRYVLPSMVPVFYTYTGSTLVQNTPPPTYNGSIQITSFYSCP